MIKRILFIFLIVLCSMRSLCSDEYTSNAYAIGFSDIVWNGSEYTAVGNYGTVIKSPDGLNWTLLDSQSNQNFSSLIWDGTQYIGARAGDVVYSIDAITWTSQNVDSENSLADLIWDGTQYIALNYDSNLYFSPDLTTWSMQTLGTKLAYSFLSVASGGGQTVIVGSEGIIFTSSDNLQWTVRDSTTMEDLYKVIYSGSLFLAVGYYGVILSSPDGVTWTSQISGTISSLNDALWDGSNFIVVGNDGSILTSADGTTWTSQNSGTLMPLTAIAWSGNEYVIVGASGSLSSSDIITWVEKDFDWGIIGSTLPEYP